MEFDCTRCNRVIGSIHHPGGERSHARCRCLLPSRAMAGSLVGENDARSRQVFRIIPVRHGSRVPAGVDLFGRPHYSLQYFGVLYHALFASIVLILIADDTISFLVSWEMMS